MMYVVKKDGTKEDFDVQKIVRAVNKSASRIMYKFKEDEVYLQLCPGEGRFS